MIQMTRFQIRISTVFCTALCCGLAICNNSVFAAGETLQLDRDTNSRIEVENSIIDGDETTIFFWTWPYMGDPNSGKACPLNYYSVTLQRGLPDIEPKILAKGVCGSALSKAGLLNNGDALIIVRDRLEQWRGGKQISSKTFSSLGATSKLGVTSDNMGGQFYDISPTGDIAIAIPAGGNLSLNFPGSKLVLTGLKPGGKKRWQTTFKDVGDYHTINDLWVARDGGALLHISPTSTDPKVAVAEDQLRIVTANGNPSKIDLIEPVAPFDVTAMKAGSNEDLQKFFEQQRNSKPEKIKTLSARPRNGGGFDVLFHRTGGSTGREGHFLYRIGTDGSLQSETPLGNQIIEHGLEDWFDFYVTNNQLVLLSRALVTQDSVKIRSNKWMQNVVSRIDLVTGVPVSRLIPLDMRYLEAAMTSGDENRQYLEGQPGGEPVMLTSVGGVPLSVGLGFLRGRFTLRLNEATDDLFVFTEAVDERNAKMAKENARQERKTDRLTRQKQMNDDMAASLGVSSQEYGELSNKERKEAMLNNGDPNAMMAAIMQQSMGANTDSGAMNAEAQAAMAQIQQAMQDAGYAMPGTAATSSTQSATTSQQTSAYQTGSSSAQTLKVDPFMRGHLQFTYPGDSLRLRVFDRKTEEEFLSKEYADGVIDEYLNFGRYKIPLEQIGVVIENQSGDVLKDLTPKKDS